MAFIEAFVNTASLYCKVEILQTVNLVFDKHETQCSIFIQEKGIEFLIELLGGSSVEIVNEAADILGKLAVKKVAYRDVIM
jgi:hypothetical protein